MLCYSENLCKLLSHPLESPACEVQGSVVWHIKAYLIQFNEQASFQSVRPLLMSALAKVEEWYQWMHVVIFEYTQDIHDAIRLQLKGELKVNSSGDGGNLVYLWNRGIM